MPIYAEDDAQGCHAELARLLDDIRFHAVEPGCSLAVLRRVESLGDSAITVLGNHDQHLLAVAEGMASLHHSRRNVSINVWIAYGSRQAHERNTSPLRID